MIIPGFWTSVSLTIFSQSTRQKTSTRQGHPNLPFQQLPGVNNPRQRGRPAPGECGHSSHPSTPHPRLSHKKIRTAKSPSPPPLPLTTRGQSGGPSNTAQPTHISLFVPLSPSPSARPSDLPVLKGNLKRAFEPPKGACGESFFLVD